MKTQLFCVTFLLICLTLSPTTTAQIVDIPDPNLRAVIEDMLGKTAGETITVADMETLTELEAVFARITNLTGLEFATNLTKLVIITSNISDLSPLRGLTNLTTLAITGSRVSDISALADLINLTFLNLTGNNISDISPLVANTGLDDGNEVWLQGNPLSLESFTTHILALQSRGVTTLFDPPPSVIIPDPNLQTAITDALGKASDHIITVADMADLTKLETGSVGINDLTGLETATNLTRLNFYGNSISDVSPLANLINLTSLHLGYNPSLSDISPLANLTNLTHLYLSYNPISDVSPLANLTNLTSLNLSWNRALSDISPLKNLTNLTFIELRHTSVSDLAPLENLINLTGLYLPNTNISDISSLKNLVNLTATDLSSNAISDLSPLIENMGLGNGTEVNVRGNPLSYLSVHTHIPALQSRRIAVYFDDQAYSALLKISGDNQRGGVDTALANPFVIEAQDANGAALAGIAVRFTVTSGDGTLNVTTKATEANGRTGNTLILGPNPGINIVEVSADGVENTVTFYAVAEIETPAIPADVSGDGIVNILDLVAVGSQFGNVGTNLAEDVNGDGVVNILDLVLVADMFGAGE